MQSKKNSLLESLTNVVVGYLVALVSQLVVFPVFDIHVELKTNLYIGLWFTVISIIRSYIFRRIYNKFTGGKV